MYFLNTHTFSFVITWFVSHIHLNNLHHFLQVYSWSRISLERDFKRVLFQVMFDKANSIHLLEINISSSICKVLLYLTWHTEWTPLLILVNSAGHEQLGHCIALQFLALQWSELYSLEFQYITVHCSTLQSIAVHSQLFLIVI